jgi:HEAT repeat protein
MKNKDPNVRFAAVRILGGIGDDDVIQALLSALRDKDFGIVKEAAKSLKRITGADFDTDYDKWKEWFEQNKDR